MQYQSAATQLQVMLTAFLSNETLCVHIGAISLCIVHLSDTGVKVTGFIENKV